MGRNVRRFGLQAADGRAHDCDVVRIDGVLWGWVEEYSLFFRWPRDRVVAETDVRQIRPVDALFVRQVCTDGRRCGPLPIEHGDMTAVGGLPVDAEVLDDLDKMHGKVVWNLHAEGGWIVGRVERRVVAIWRMPKGFHMIETRMVLHEGAVWMSNGRFACLLSGKVAGDARRQIERRAERDTTLAASVAGILAEVDKLADKKVLHLFAPAQVTRKKDGSVWIGESRIPADQYLAILANQGSDLVWRWTAPLAPVAAFRAGKVVAVVMPIPTLPSVEQAEPNAPGGTA